MKSSYSIVPIKKNKTDKEGYLFLRRKGKEKRTKLSLKIKVDVALFKKHWNKVDMCFKSGMPNYKLYNQQIEKVIAELDKNNGNIISHQKDKKSFLNFWEIKISEIENHNTRIRYTGIKTKFEKYLASIGKTDIYFSELNPDFFKDLQKHLKTAKDPKQLSANGVTFCLKVIKGVINLKLEEEPYLFVVNPYTGLKYDPKKETDRPVLQDLEIDKLLNTEIENDKINLNRNKFLFQIFAQGMRVSDLLLLRWNNVLTGLPIKASTVIPAAPVGRDLKPQLKYRMWKTDVPVETPITYNICMILLNLIGMEWRAYEILEDTLYPVGDSKHPMIHTGQVKYFEIFKSTPHLKLSQIEEKLNSLCSKATNRDNIEYKGYTFRKELDELKGVIDFIEEKKESLSAKLIEETMYRLTVHIYTTKCLNDFVFPHLKNDFFKDVKTSPVSGFKGKLTFEQNQKLLNGETLYNRQLKQVAEMTGLITNLISHGGRHTFAQLMLNEGAPTHIIMEALRHTNLMTTDKYLRHKNFKNNGTDYISQIGNKQKYRKS